MPEARHRRGRALGAGERAESASESRNQLDAVRSIMIGEMACGASYDGRGDD